MPYCMRISDWSSDVCSSDLLITLGVTYRVVGGTRFYERKEVRDAVAYLRVIHQGDDDLAFERIVNVPRRGIGDTTLRAVHGYARAQGLSLTRAVDALVQTDELPAAARRSLKALMEARSEEHTSELQSLMHISYAVFCLKKKKKK